MQRSSGVLMHITSLPAPYGIGTLGDPAKSFLDFLSYAGQKWWQVLPIHPVGYGASPYQPSCSFAGNTLLIDLDELRKDGLLTRDFLEDLPWGDDPSFMDFEAVCAAKDIALRAAFAADPDAAAKAADFAKSHFWAMDFALYTALKAENDGAAWYQWEDDLKLRDAQAINQAKERLEDEINFVLYCQHLFFAQWESLKEYAGQLGIGLIGDAPIYVAYDSSDVWQDPASFQLDKDLTPVAVAGCPPDYFSPDGQLWGNPLYDWDALKQNGYKWWEQRLTHLFNLFDLVRIDHFRGFASYFSIPYGDTTAKNGVWKVGPGKDLFDTLEQKLGKLPLIAEDLGLLTDDVFELMDHCGYPGMKVLQFAFGSDAGNLYLPHNHIQNCITYTGTHDNDTLLGWWQSTDAKTRRYMCRYLRLKAPTWDMVCEALIETNMASVSNLCIAPLQDFLGLDNRSRMNTPGTVGFPNWCWRVNKDKLSDQLAKAMFSLCEIYGRI